MAKHYSKSFKQQAVEAYFKSNLYIKAFSKQHNIPARTIRGWVRQDSRYSSHTPEHEDTFVPIEVTPPELKEAPDGASHVLSEIQKLYMIERKAKDEDMSFTDRKSLLMEKAKPILDSLEKFMIEELLPNTWNR